MIYELKPNGENSSTRSANDDARKSKLCKGIVIEEKVTLAQLNKMIARENHQSNF